MTATNLTYHLELAAAGTCVNGTILDGGEWIVNFTDGEAVIVDRDFFDSEEDAEAAGRAWIAQVSE